MDNEIRFKFSPVYNLYTNIYPFFFIYLFVDGFYSDINVELFIIACGSSWIFLPNIFKMLFGIPAFILLQDQLINNVSGLKIDWKDIRGLKIRDRGRVTFLMIKLINPEKYIEDSAFRRMFNYLISSDDDVILINISCVEGSNTEIVHAIKNFKILHDRRTNNKITSLPDKTAPDIAP